MKITTGTYRMRNGARAVVLKVESDYYTFPVKGTVYRAGRNPEYCIWTDQGRFYAGQRTHGYDLVERTGD